MTQRNPNPTPNARVIVFGIFLLTVLAIFTFEKVFAAAVEYNPEGSPIPIKEMERAIQQSIWQHSSRYEVDAEYAGTTGEDEAEGKIIVQWENLGLFDERLGFAHWWTKTATGEFVRARIVLNADQAPKSVDACLIELITHELGHVFRLEEGHSDNPEDVMFPVRGDCRYSLSLADIQFIGRRLSSCHVELTTEGSLEYLDYNGKRISLAPLHNAYSLEPPRFGFWIWGSISQNPEPQYCNGIIVDGSDVWAEVKSFGKPPTVLRLKMDQGLFRSVPLRP